MNDLVINGVSGWRETQRGEKRGLEEKTLLLLCRLGSG